MDFSPEDKMSDIDPEAVKKKKSRKKKKKKKEKKKQNTVVVETLEELGEVSTVHGLRYAVSDIRGNSRGSRIDQVVWILIVLGCTIAAAILSARMYMAWKNQPVVTTIGTASLPITELEFPAVTLCSPGNDLGNLYKIHKICFEDWDPWWAVSGYNGNFEAKPADVRDTIVAEFVRDMIPGWPQELTLERFLLHMTTYHPTLVKTIMLWNKNKEYVPINTPGIDVLLNPSREQEMVDALKDVEREVDRLFKDVDFSSVVTRRVLLSLLWFTALPCKELLIQCSWKNIDVPCKEIFHLIPTDIGFCCSFNHHSITKLMRNSSFAATLYNIEQRYKKYGKDPNEPEWDKEENMPPVTPQAGKQNGLKVVLDMKTKDLTTASVQQEFHGIQAAVGTQGNSPVMLSDSFVISPGFETQVEISAQQTVTTDDLRNAVDPEQRNCYYDDEFYLAAFSTYSMTNCWVECLMNLSRYQCPDDCTPWNFPSIDGSLPCKPIEQFCFNEAYRSIDMNKVIGTEICLPNCADTHYKVSATSAPFRPCDKANFGLTPLCTIDLGSTGIRPHKWANLVEESYNTPDLPAYIELDNPIRVCPARLQNLVSEEEYDAFEKDVASVLFYFNRPFATQLVSSPKMTMTVFISNVGGLLGLFIGFSLISLIEIAYWLSVGFAINTIERKKVAGEQKTELTKVEPIKENEPQTHCSKLANFFKFWKLPRNFR